jgi:hypothetical protein
MTVGSTRIFLIETGVPETETEYALVTRSPSPFPQHKGHPLDFGSLHVGKAYVSLHLMPLYMCSELS